MLPALGASTGMAYAQGTWNHPFLKGKIIWTKPSCLGSSRQFSGLCLLQGGKRITTPLPILQWQYQGTSPGSRCFSEAGSHFFIHNNGFKQQWWNGFYKSWHWSIKKYHQTNYHIGTIYEKITSICIVNCLSSWNLKSEKRICIFITPVVFSTESGQMSSNKYVLNDAGQGTRTSFRTYQYALSPA